MKPAHDRDVTQKESRPKAAPRIQISNASHLPWKRRPALGLAAWGVAAVSIGHVAQLFAMWECLRGRALLQMPLPRLVRRIIELGRVFVSAGLPVVWQGGFSLSQQSAMVAADSLGCGAGFALVAAKDTYHFGMGFCPGVGQQDR